MNLPYIEVSLKTKMNFDELLDQLGLILKQLRRESAQKVASYVFENRKFFFSFFIFV